MESSPPSEPRSAPPALWVLTVASLLLNVMIIFAVIALIVVARQFAGRMADELDAFGKQTFNYSFRVTQTVPIRTSVPFQQKLVIPFHQTIPISTSVTVGKELPVIGEIKFDVPIDTSVPISLEIPIDVDQTIPINTDVPINLQVPLQIPIANTPLKGTLDQMVKMLNTFAGR